MTDFMKYKLLMPAIACAVSVATWANPISVHRAKAIAARYLSAPTLQGEQAATRAGADAQAPYYMFNNDGGQGFVIVSGDDRLPEVVGYSRNGAIDAQDMPDALRSLLAHYASVVKAVQQGKTPAVPKPTHRKASVQPLLTCKWDQNYPYNLYTPRQNGAACYTGCGATALAQMLYFHKWPKKRPADYVTGEGTLAQLEDHYLWDEMRDDYRQPASELSRSAVGVLMSDAGRASRMTYGTVGSTTNAGNIWTGVVNRFDYSVKHLEKDHMPGGAFLQAVMNEIEAGYPVLVEGGPHLFVYDGYDENGYLHVNWGWSGALDGYFDINITQVDGESYWKNQIVLFLRPNDGKHTPFPPTESVLTVQNSEGLYFKESEIARNGKLTPQLKNVGVRNLPQGELGTYTGKVGIALFDAEGKRVHVFESPFGDMTWSTYFTSFNFITNFNPWQLDFSTLSTLPQGNYTLCPMGQRLTAAPATYEDWRLMENGNEVKLTVSADKIVLHQEEMTPKIELFGKIETLNPVYANTARPGAIALQVYNRSRFEGRGKLTIIATGNGKTQEMNPTMPTLVAERLAANEWVVPIYPSYSSSKETVNLTPGRYTLTFRFKFVDKKDKETGVSVDLPTPVPFELEVLPQDKNGILSITQLDFYKDGALTDLQIFDPATTTRIGFAVHTQLLETAKSSYPCKLRYRLKDLATGMFVEVGEAASVEIPYGWKDMTDKSLQYVPVSTLTPGKVYEVHVEVEKDGVRRDVWGTTVSRRRLMLQSEDTSTGVASLPMSEAQPQTVYNLQGIRLTQPWNTLPVGIYIVDGKKVWKR